MTDDHDVARTFGLDPDPTKGLSAVPMALDLLGPEVIVDDGQTRERAVLVVDSDAFARAAWMKREAARLIATWRAGNLTIWSLPEAHGQPGRVEITDETGATRSEEVPWPVFKALQDARREAGGET
ncbi:MAG: hypothetical protein ACLQGJ_04255 [Candidatus Dormibacteria bacterium]